MKKIIAIFIATMLLITVFVGCGAGSGPSESQIKKDIEEYDSEYPYKHILYVDMYHDISDENITDMEIEYSDCKADTYEAKVHVTFSYKYSNGGYSKITDEEDTTLYVKYKYYSNGGWKLVEVDDV